MCVELEMVLIFITLGINNCGFLHFLYAWLEPSFQLYYRLNVKSLSAGVFLVVSSWEREKTSHIRQYIRKPEEDDDYDGNAQKWIPTLNFRHQGIETKKNTNCFTVLDYAPLHSSSNKKNFSIFRKDDICILVSSYLYSRQFLKIAREKFLRSSEFHYDFFGEFNGARHMKNINLVTLCCCI